MLVGFSSGFYTSTFLSGTMWLFLRKKLKKAAMIAAASMFVMMMPMIQTHAAPTDVIENNESGIPDKTLYQNILKVLGKQSTDTFTEQEASSVEELEIVDYKKIPMERNRLSDKSGNSENPGSVAAFQSGRSGWKTEKT